MPHADLRITLRVHKLISLDSQTIFFFFFLFFFRFLHSLLPSGEEAHNALRSSRTLLDWALMLLLISVYIIIRILNGLKGIIYICIYILYMYIYILAVQE